MASAGNRVVVWEFSENVRWIPYEPNVTRFIEQQLASGANAARLGEVDPSLNDYAIDLDNMEQIEHVSGACHLSDVQTPSLAPVIHWQCH